MLRDAIETDLPAILEIYNEAIKYSTAVYTYEPQTLEDRTKWFEEKSALGYPVVVAEEEQRIIGFATFGPFRAWPAFKYTVEHSLYVHESYRGKGIGKQLLAEMIRRADDHGVATLVAGIDSANLGSIALHRQLGFYHAGTIRRAGYKFGRWLDLMFYQLDLEGPSEPTER